MKTFDEFVKPLYPKLRVITNRISKYSRYIDSDDLLQEALSYLWKSQLSGTLNDKTESYILQGCYFHLRNYLRVMLKEEDRTMASLDMPVDGAYILPAEKPNNEYDAVKYVINNIGNRREEEVLRLCSSGYTTREIGRKLGISHVMVTKIEKSLHNKLYNMIAA